MLSFEDKIFVKNLWECKRFSARRLLMEFPNKNWKQFTWTRSCHWWRWAL